MRPLIVLLGCLLAGLAPAAQDAPPSRDGTSDATRPSSPPFTEVGVFRRAGWKFGAGHDVSWRQRPLRDEPPRESAVDEKEVHCPQP